MGKDPNFKDFYFENTNEIPSIKIQNLEEAEIENKQTNGIKNVQDKFNNKKDIFKT